MRTREEGIRNILIWLVETVMAEGGDGDAIWITKWHTLEELLPIVKELNQTHWNNWWTIERNDTDPFGDCIVLANHQESLVITTNQKYPVPSWSHCTLRF